MHDHRVVEQRPVAFLDGVEPLGEVGELLDEELVHLEPIRAIAVREKVMDHVIDAVAGLLDAWKVRETQGTVVVVEFQRGDTRGVGLESENHDIHHEAHVLCDVLRDTVGRARSVRLFDGWAPALEFSTFPGVLEPFLDISDAFEIFVKFVLIILAQCFADGFCVGEHGIEHADVCGRAFVFEEAVEREGGIEFEGCWGGGRAPGDVGAVEHGIVLVDGRVRLFAGQHEARDLGVASVGLCEDLVEAGS